MNNMITELQQLRELKKDLLETDFETKISFDNMNEILNLIYKEKDFVEDLKKFFKIDNDLLTFNFNKYDLRFSFYFETETKIINLTNFNFLERIVNKYTEKIQSEIKLLKSEINILKGEI
jgi:uncharacterized ubiquitin-like protein YukD